MHPLIISISNITMNSFHSWQMKVIFESQQWKSLHNSLQHCNYMHRVSTNKQTVFVKTSWNLHQLW